MIRLIHALPLLIAASLSMAMAMAIAAEPTDRTAKRSLSIETLESECAADQSASCDEASLRYQFGRGVAADPAKAAALRLRLCDLGSASECGLYAGRVWLSKPGYPKKDIAIVARYAKRGCLGNDALSCGLAYTVSKTPNTYGAADRATLYRKLCAVGKPADCGAAAYDEGERGNYPLAIDLAKQACAKGQSYACSNANAYAVRQQNREKRAAAAARPSSPPAANRPSSQSGASMYQPSSDRRSRNRDQGRSGTESCSRSGGGLGTRYWYYGFNNQKQYGPCI
ncbi:MAG: hypothetical protein DI569_07570 [Sphingopyxis macrogoltabida]|uniref:Beta-lactamase n=1 Tax=Sphingopyxis macrogoltabida TaxID=33050 RepID=A0A2W5L032_SPHMC|nr:MAG: hypothetical protein DI569_07570 [Sphingopyxis macrogoltabida]